MNGVRTNTFTLYYDRATEQNVNFLLAATVTIYSMLVLLRHGDGVRDIVHKGSHQNKDMDSFITPAGMRASNLKMGAFSVVSYVLII